VDYCDYDAFFFILKYGRNYNENAILMTDNLRLKQAVRNIDDGNFGVRKKAIQIIAKEKYEPAVPKLTNVLFDDKIEERTRALTARALGKIGTDKAFRALVTVLSEIDPAILTQVAVRYDRLETAPLNGAMLSAALIFALRSMGTTEARVAVSRWQKGELAKR